MSPLQNSCLNDNFLTLRSSGRRFSGSHRRLWVSLLTVSFTMHRRAATGRLETATLDSQRPRTDPGAGSLSPAKSRQPPPDPNSGHRGEAVCSLPSCRVDGTIPLSRRLLPFLSFHFSFWAVSAFKQRIAEQIIRCSDVALQKIR